MKLSSRIRSAVIAVAMLAPTTAMAANDVAMHRDPGCGCCSKWAAQVREQLGRPVKIIDNGRRSALQKGLGVPEDLSSCHTALVDGMVVEGHVPPADMKRLLAQRPKGVKGIAVAGMPLGSPGMEVPGMKPQSYNVVAFGPSGKKVFARH